MKKISLIFSLVVVLILVAGATDLFAQCAMCKAAVKDNAENGGIGQGLNKGILYLMSVPYIIGAVIAVLWYKSSKKDSEKQQLIDKIRSKFAK